TGVGWKTSFSTKPIVKKNHVIIPNEQRNYLREIVKTVRDYHKKTEEQVEAARRLYQLEGALEMAKDSADLTAGLTTLKKNIEARLTKESQEILNNWEHV